MNIAIPVSAHDKHLLPRFIEVLQHFGGLEDSTICLFATPSAKQEAYDAAAKINAAVHTFEVDFAGGWPVASSTQFAATVFTLPKLGWSAPWLWMELDMLPVQKDWLQTLRRGYTLCGHPFMGNVVPTAWIENGKLVVHDDDLMMMGCGVYPANMHADERFRPLLTDLIKPAPMNPATPFDFYLRHAMRQAGIADTRLIADMWQTHKYRRTADGIVCEPVPLDKPRRERGGLVPAEAVLAHGCKDGTLAELVLGASPATIAPSPAPKITEIVLTEQQSEKIAKAVETAPPSPMGVVEVAIDEKLPPGSGALVVLKTDKPKPLNRSAVESARKQNGDNAKKTAAALGLSFADFVKQLPTLGYVIVKGGKLQSTQL